MFNIVNYKEFFVKAKRKHKGAWLTGFICVNPVDNNSIGIQDVNDETNKFPIYEVDKNTICKSTGVEDSCGTPLFHHDVLEWDDDGETKIAAITHDIDCYFCGEDSLEKILRFDVKIIGNIIDDPALDPYADEKRRNV